MTDNKNNDDWTDCQGGEIADLSQKLRQNRVVLNSRRRILTTSITAATLMLCVGLTLLISQRPVNNSENYVCAEVADFTEGYFKHQLDPKVVARIEKHLDHCKLCREHYAAYQETHPDQLSLLSKASRRSVLAMW